MNHTPGPWILGHQLAYPDLRLSVHQQDGWTIALCDMRVRPTEENEANARLIAAAPQLLEALEAVYNRYSCEMFGTIPEALMKQMLMVIAAAKGSE